MPGTNWEDLLPADDVSFLKSKYPAAQVYRVGEEVHVLFPAFPFPAGYSPSSADLVVRLVAGYPDAHPDMFWTKPDVKLSSGAWPAASDVHEIPGAGTGVEVYAGIPWQRWSRHIQKSDWRAGVDGLQTFVGTIKSELNQKR
jgi:hypothetical protein